MPSVTEMADDIIAREGGFVDDPDDPGGATRYGVTIGTLKRLNIDADGNGAVDANDLRALGKSEARAIYIRHYYRGPHIDQLPECLQHSVFDMYVNSGSTAVRLLQQLLCDMNFIVRVDGIIGPQTAAAARAAAAAAPDYLSDAYGIARRNYYYRLAGLRPQFRKFARARDGGKGGWIRRAEEFIRPRYRLSEAEHAERIAQWV